MSRVLGIRTVKPGERLYQPLTNMLLFQASMLIAIKATTGNPPDAAMPGPKNQVITMSYVANMQFGFAAFEALDDAIRQKEQRGIGISFLPGVPPSSSINNLAKLPHYLDQMFAACFVLHYEACRVWLEDNGYGDTSTYPMTIDFARTVRNAVAHAGTLLIKPTKRGNAYRPVSWNALTYSEADSGRKVLGVDFYAGDMLALMFDVDDELVALGASR